MKNEKMNESVAFERGLPASPEAERLILGALLLQPGEFQDIAAVIRSEDFSIHKNSLIFGTMEALSERGVKLDRISVIEELRKRGQLESVDGIGYVISLDDGLPRIVNLENYARIIREKSQLRQIFYAASQLRDQALLGEEHPDAIRAAGEEALLGISSAVRSRAASPEEIINEMEGGLEAFLNPSSRGGGIQTGLVRFDSMTGGLREGELFVLAARPSMGKTALALNIADFVVSQPDSGAVVVFSLEMTREAVLQRIVCSAARVDMQKFRMGFTNADERRRLAGATNRLFESKLKVDDSGDIGLMEIHSTLRMYKRKYGLSLAVIDYLQLLASRGKSENRTQEVSKISRGLKLIAKDLRIPIIALSQLSRGPESRKGDHRPILSDLRESGGIEQDADLVAFLFREEYYSPDREDLRGVAELNLAKQRNGPVGRINLCFLKEYAKFENLAQQMGIGEEDIPKGYSNG